MTPVAERVRDAERSRAAILDAAEGLFAERGFGGTSLSDIGAAAGLSRQAPSYFFGSKERLHRAVLERVFAARQEATAAAFAPVVAWVGGKGGRDELEAALTAAAEGYLAFLLDRPAFARLLVREELDGAARLRRTPRASTAMTDAFGALRAVAPRRGIAPFAVEDAVLLFVALTFAPLALEATLLHALGRDLRDELVRRDHVARTVDQLLHLVAR